MESERHRRDRSVGIFQNPIFVELSCRFINIRLRIPELLSDISVLFPMNVRDEPITRSN